jgi:hypothetical protein
MSPKIDVLGGWDIFVFPREGTEPPHVHIGRFGKAIRQGKYWLTGARRGWAIYPEGATKAQIKWLTIQIESRHDVYLKKYQSLRPSDGSAKPS